MEDQSATGSAGASTGRSDPFDILGLGGRFDVTPSAIRRAHRARVAAAHPDTNVAREAGQADTAVLNQARDDLLDPERRANALLARLGGPSASDERSLPDGFLMEVMELRMEVEAVLAEDESARAGVQDQAEARRGDMIDQVTDAFAALGDPPDKEALSSIRTQLNAWRYVERLIEQLDPEYDPARADFGG